MKGIERVENGAKLDNFYDLHNEADNDHININKTGNITSVISVQETAAPAVKIMVEPIIIEPFVAKSAHEVFRSLVNAATCANETVAKKPEGFYIITPSSFCELC